MREIYTDIFIVGAGPAGLTAAFEALKNNAGKVLVVEKTNDFGGISKTVNYKGNRIDIGGHRFFSKSDEVMDWWANIMPVESSSSKSDKVMLVRNRLSRIYFLKKFFDYPVSLSLNTIKNLGLVRMAKIGFSYLKSIIFKIRPEKNLEDFFTNRFGRELYLTFFKDYTEKVWGEKCQNIPADWGAQRVKGLSVYTALKNVFSNLFNFAGKGVSQKNKETSLIEKFLYPKYGPGQMWEEVALRVQNMGGEIMKGTSISKIILDQKSNKVLSVEIISNGEKILVHPNYFISSMPVKELVSAIGGVVPAEVIEVAEGLKYRDFVTVGVLMNKMSSGFTDKKIVPDNWIYIQEPYVKVGRLQVFNNWSPFLVKDKNTVWIGMEYFCNEGDGFWNMGEAETKSLAIKELEELGIADKEDVIDSTVIKMEKAYPAYFGSYDRFDTVKNYINNIKNLFVVGRNGMHRYNNQDHSMLTAIEAIKQIKSGKIEKEKIWSINTEKEYHEKK